MPKSFKLLPSSRLLCIVPIIGAASLIAADPAAADPQELRVTEHNTTQTITDTGATGDSAGDILTFGPNDVFDADDKNKVGTDQGICFRIVPGKSLGVLLDAGSGEGSTDCRGTLLRQGRLSARHHRWHRRVCRGSR